MKSFLFPLFITLLILTSCKSDHLLKDSNYRNLTHKSFMERKEIVANRDSALFSVFNRKLETREKEALEFLFAYAPVSDLSDYNGDFFLNQVRYAFLAKETFLWGKDIPDDIFLHFVLPYRVNNENLDSARMVFFHELRERIAGLTLEEAALEVNHWCHEKVSYHPADIRTSSPLATVRTAYGRCGEESTLTVTALRAVGIPSRQVYTPRWAHTDDNHAWVEVWIDGRWKYLGACEPMPRLNMAWFTGPAKRAMMVHTTAFGMYTGNEAEIIKKDKYSILNRLCSYADTATLKLQILDPDSAVVTDAEVSFGLFNYAEFYPIASLRTDKNGIASLVTGKGTLYVQANKDEQSASAFINVSGENKQVLVLTNNSRPDYPAEMIHIPPVKVQVTEQEESGMLENESRLKQEDSVREAYISGFISEEESRKFAVSIGADPGKLTKLLSTSRGNWKVIKDFLDSYRQFNISIPLLEHISEKDLRDISPEVLEDNMDWFLSGNFEASDFNFKYLLNPRVKNELLRPYKNYFVKEFKPREGTNSQIVIEILAWINKEFRINDSEQYYSLPATPKGFYEIRTGNRESRNIFFVALCRSLGIPARMDPVQSIPEYFENGSWTRVIIDKLEVHKPVKGYIGFRKDKLPPYSDPAYSVQLSLARLNKGNFESINIGEGIRLSQLPEMTALDTGFYRLLTAFRENDGTARIRNQYFYLREDEHKILFPEFSDPGENRYYKSVGFPVSEFTEASGGLSYRMPETGKEYIFCWTEPGTEPTTHLLEELNSQAGYFQNWDGQLVLILPEGTGKETASGYPELNKYPGAAFFHDRSGDTLNKLRELLFENNEPEYPLIIICTKDGKTGYISSGYRVGLADQILFNLREGIECEK